MQQRYESETNSAIGRTPNRFVIQILSFVSGDISLTECRAYWRVRPSGKQMKHLLLATSAALSLSFIAVTIGQTKKEKEETAVFGASPSPSASVSATVVASPSASISLTPTPSPR